MSDGAAAADASEVARRVAGIHERIAAACAGAGRDVGSVTLVAASKSQPAERLRAAWAAGVRTFGENRVQEAAGKHAELADLVDAKWHLLGPLQSNKVRQATELFSTYHALDRPKILTAVAAEAQRRGT